MFVIGKHGATDKLVAVGVRTFGDNAVAVWEVIPGKDIRSCFDALFRSTERLLLSPSFRPSATGLGIALHHGGFSSSFLLNLIRIGVGAGWKNDQAGTSLVS